MAASTRGAGARRARRRTSDVRRLRAVALALMRAIARDEQATMILNVRNRGTLPGWTRTPSSRSRAPSTPAAPVPLRVSAPTLHQLGLVAAGQGGRAVDHRGRRHRLTDLAAAGLRPAPPGRLGDRRPRAVARIPRPHSGGRRGVPPVTLDARPDRTSHRPGDEVVILVDSVVAQRVSVVVTHLGEEVRRSDEEVTVGRTRVSLGVVGEGSFAVRLASADGSTATTAFDVSANALARPRYGFVTDFLPGRVDGDEVADSLRAFHLNAVQFYDWMYRHASLLPPSDDFVDALDRSLSLTTRPPARGRDARRGRPGDRLRRRLWRRTRVCGRAPRGSTPPPGRPALDARRLPLDHGRLPGRLVRHVVAQMSEAVAPGRVRRAAPRPVRRPEGRGLDRRDGRRPRGRVRGARSSAVALSSPTRR